jgi:hypothetical protein
MMGEHDSKERIISNHNNNVIGKMTIKYMKALDEDFRIVGLHVHLIIISWKLSLFVIL